MEAELFKVGDRVFKGDLEGTVVEIKDNGKLFVQWDKGSSVVISANRLTK